MISILDPDSPHFKQLPFTVLFWSYILPLNVFPCCFIHLGLWFVNFRLHILMPAAEIHCVSLPPHSALTPHARRRVLLFAFPIVLNWGHIKYPSGKEPLESIVEEINLFVSFLNNLIFMKPVSNSLELHISGAHL